MDLDPDLVFRERGSRFGAGDPGGRRGVPAGERATGGTRGRGDVPSDAGPGREARGVRRGRAVRFAGAPAARRARSVPPRPVVPGERRYRDGDRVRHARWGDGIVITSKLTRDDEEVTVAFRDPSVGRKTMLASLANLELIG